MMRLLFVLTTLTALLLSACGAMTPTPDKMMDKPTDAMMDKPTDSMMEKPTDEMMDKPTDEMMDKPTDEMMDKPTDEMMDKPTDDMMHDETATPDAMMAKTPAWFGVELTDARTGKTFSINSFKGKVVLVETMAQWCSNCLKQQTQVKALHDMLGMNDDFVSIGLDIDPNENAVDLKKYVESKGFDWYYAVPPADVTREIGNLYTAQFLNPPSTPILIVDRKGVAHPLPFGIKSADDLAAAVKMYLEE